MFLCVFGHLAGQGSSREGGRGEGKPSPWVVLELRPKGRRIFDDIWGHFGATLELILETVGVFFDPCRLQEPTKEGSGGHSEPEPLFHRCWALPQGAQEGSRCSGSSVFTLAASGK